MLYHRTLLIQVDTPHLLFRLDTLSKPHTTFTPVPQLPSVAKHFGSTTKYILLVGLLQIIEAVLTATPLRDNYDFCASGATYGVKVAVAKLIFVLATAFRSRDAYTQ